MAAVCVLTPGPAFAISGPPAPEAVQKIARTSLATILPQDNAWICSGVLVTRRHVLTAGHCLLGEVANLDIVFHNDAGQEIRAKIKKHTLHPLWEKNYPAFKEWVERTEAFHAEFRKIHRIEKKLNRRFREEQIAESCGITKLAPLDLKDTAVIRAASERMNRYRSLIYRLNLSSSETRESRMACLKWVEAAGALYGRVTKLMSQADDLMAQPRFPADLAILELENPVPAELQPMKLDLRKISEAPKEILIAGSGFNLHGESGRPRMAMAAWFGEVDDAIISGGSAVTCSGDSGGAFARLREDVPYLIAINSEVKSTSGGTDCKPGDNTGLATRLADYAEWIRATIKLKDKSK